jgi:predicted alpha/beta hydrolase
MRKRCHRRTVIAVPPKGLRPRLASADLSTVQAYALINFDAIANGTAEPVILWDLVGGVLTWWKVSRLLGVGEPEMDAQLELTTRLVERFKRTGRVLFDGPDLQLARQGVMVMDQLAELVDTLTAAQAAAWSMVEVNRISAQARTYRQEAEARHAA